MEEKKHETVELTAERSLEIITQSLEQNRTKAAKSIGTTLLISGWSTIGMTTLFLVLNYFYRADPYWRMYLWYVLPFIIWGLIRYFKRNDEPTPPNIIGKLVHKTWWTFAIFAFVFSIFSQLYNRFLATFFSINEFVNHHISSSEEIIIPLMGMAIAVTGNILKFRWMVVCGIIGGLGGYLCYVAFYVAARILNPTHFMVLYQSLHLCVILFCCLIGLVLPGYIIKRK